MNRLIATLVTLATALPAFADEDKAGPNDNKPPEGFTALFNGKDLGAWRAREGQRRLTA